MKKVFLCFFIVSLCIQDITAQKELPIVHRYKVPVYNILLGGLSCATFTLLTNPNDNNKKKKFWKSFGLGTIGGSIMLSAKYLNKNQYESHPSINYVSKFIYSTGYSIIQNQIQGKKFYSNYYYNLGFNRLEVNLLEKKINYKLMPIGFGFFVGGLITRKFDINKSILIGEIVFNDAPFSYSQFNHIHLSGNRSTQVLYHEISHLYQYRDFDFFNSYFDKKLKKKYLKYSKLTKHLYINYNQLPFRVLYALESLKFSSCYFVNFFEFEAGYFSNYKLCFE